ncbi:MAG: dipeptide epimerase [Gemmatimonadetes bacterium]|nr:dipeptide epimerase [Gemmatimonadota bacterium]
MRLEYDILELRTSEPFHIARPSDPHGRRNVRVRLIADDGVSGMGEAAPNVFYGETAETVAAVLPRYATVMEEEDPFSLARIEGALEVAVRRNPAARSAISAALHDLAGKRLGQPVWRLWGLDPATAPLSSFTLGMAGPEETREKARQAARRPVLKIKVGRPDDEARLAAIRDEAPDALLYVDANTAWTAKEALGHMPMLEAMGVAFVEQPLHPDDHRGLRLLRRRARLPIVADESCETATDVARLVGAVDGINIKLAKAGSLLEARRMAEMARAHGLIVMLGCMVESTLGIAAAVQLAPLMDYLDLDGALLLAEDPHRGPGMNEDGSIRFNAEPGLGVTPAARADDPPAH